MYEEMRRRYVLVVGCTLIMMFVLLGILGGMIYVVLR